MNTSGYIRGPWVKRYNKFGDYEVIDSLGRDITIIEGYDNDAAGDESTAFLLHQIIDVLFTNLENYYGWKKTNVRNCN